MNFCKVTGEKPSIGAKEERYPDNRMRYLDYARKERSDGIASKQMRLVRASVTIISQVIESYIKIHNHLAKQSDC